MTTPENPNQDPNQVPQYGTPEYEAWYAQQNPNYEPGRHAAAEPPAKKSHKIRNSIIGVFAGVVALIVVIGVATSGGDKTNKNGGSNPAPAAAAATQPTDTTSEDYPTPSDTPSDTPSPSDTTDTSMLDLNPGATVSVQDTDNGGQADITVSGPSVITPGEYDEAPQGRYIGVKVTMKVTTGSFEINPYDFTLRSVDGTEVDQAFLDGDQTHPSLNDGTGTANGGIDQVAGWLVFDLPAGFQGQLQYVPGLSDVLGSWKIGA